jgi:hypothetical protein
MAIQKAPGVKNKYLEDLQKEIIAEHTPLKGWCDIEHCTACIEAENRIDAAIDAADRAYAISAYEARVRNGEAHQAEQNIYNRGFRDGQDEAVQLAHRWANQAANQAAAAAKQRWYSQGLREGKASMPQLPPIATGNDPAARKKFFDEAMNECHIIGESNPQMKPGMNALSRMLKKRLKGPRD